MNTHNRFAKTLMFVICSISLFMSNLIFFSPPASAQSDCVSHANGVPQAALPVYMTQATEQDASAITDNSTGGVGFDSDVIRYEYHLPIDPVLSSQIAGASEACIIFTTSSKVIQSGHGLAEYATSLKIGHRPVGASSFQTFNQQFDDRSTALGAVGTETIQYAISLNVAGIVVADGDQLGIAIDGLSVADSLQGPSQDYANASLYWLIGSAQINQPRLVIY